MPKKLNCQNAYYNPDEYSILCKKENTLCGHQFYCNIEGKYLLTVRSKKCPFRNNK
jgi:hypothetical protein